MQLQGVHLDWAVVKSAGIQLTSFLFLQIWLMHFGEIIKLFNSNWNSKTKKWFYFRLTNSSLWVVNNGVFDTLVLCFTLVTSNLEIIDDAMYLGIVQKGTMKIYHVHQSPSKMEEMRMHIFALTGPVWLSGTDWLTD